MSAEFHMEFGEIRGVLNNVRRINPFLGTVPLYVVVEEYRKLNPPKDGLYTLNFKIINELITHLVVKAYMKMMDQGIVDMVVMEDGELAFVPAGKR